MFTGIIQATGTITARQERDGDLRLTLDTGALDMSRTAIGDSIAVNGCCLTVIDLHAKGFSADVSRETLNLTTLGTLMQGARVNLEAAAVLGQPLGGHLLSGHVDGLGELLSRAADARSQRLTFRAPESLARYIARKGSIAIDGVSLTVNTVSDNVFTVNIVPHTLAATTMGDYTPGQRVNLEVDMVARYLERLLSADADLSANPAHEALQRYGYI